MQRITTRQPLLLTGMLLALAGCSSDNPSNGGDGPPIKDASSGDVGNLKGTVKTADGKAVGDASVKAGSASTTANFKGEYELTNVPAGAVTVIASATWFAASQTPATVKAGQTVTLDLQLAALPLKIDAADRKLADELNKTFDWTKDTLSIAVIDVPSKKSLENAVWFRNPAMHRDTAAEEKVTPSPELTLGGAAPTGFDFPVAGKQALDPTTIVDSLDKTPIPAASRGDWMTWERTLKLLTDWDLAKSTGLSAVGAAIRQQQWGGKGVRPQEIERVWLQDDAMWISIVFEGFVELGAGIGDSDGDGRKEVFAKIAAEHYTKELVAKVRTDYLQGPRLGTLALKEVVDDIINDLYDVTNPEIVRTIGQPFEVPGKGTLTYPFAVFKHADGKHNVLLVGP